MKAADITVGEAYFAEYEYGRKGKVTVLEVPVVRMTTVVAGGGKTRLKPYRRDGRADGARVRVERTGRTVDVALTKVIRPWEGYDDEREARYEDGRARVAATRAKLASFGLVNDDVWRGQGVGAESCTVMLPFVEFEALLRRVDPVWVVTDAVRAAQAIVTGDDCAAFAREIERQAVALRERWAAGFETAEPPAADDDVVF